MKEFEKIWNTFEPPSEKLPSAPILGYRGCLVRNDDINREWLVYDGSVTLKTYDGSKSRLDRQPIFEEPLLSSAPHSEEDTEMFFQDMLMDAKRMNIFRDLEILKR